LNAIPVPRQPSSDAHALDAVAPNYPEPDHTTGRCPWGDLARKWLDEADSALNEVAMLTVERDRALKRARAAEGRARRADKKLAEVFGPRERYPRSTQQVEDRFFDLVLEILGHLRERGGATPDELLDLAVVIANAGRPAAGWEAAQRLAEEVAS
jgi:hypothetical protein